MKTCPRDRDGFCRLAAWGWPKCFKGKDHDQCHEDDPNGNLEAARQLALRRISLSAFGPKGSVQPKAKASGA